MDNFFCRSCETLSTARCPAVDSFLLLPFNGTLHDFGGFQLVSISVSVCDFDVELHTQDLVKFLQRRLFQDIFKMAGLAPASEDVRSFTVLWSRLKDCAYLFTGTELSSCIECFV